MELFAKDGFKGSDGVWGGDLVDVKTPFAARDKVQHFVIGMILAMVLNKVFCNRDTYGILLALAVLWEIFELLRFTRWQHKGTPAIWPIAADRFSWRDIVATMAGGLIVFLL